MSTTFTHRTVEFVPDAAVPAKALGLVRIALGLTMLWAFLDKTFALGFSTGRMEDGSIAFLGDAAWINGGSPTFGFLKFGTSGPLAGFFSGMAGVWWADWLFMLGLLGVGVAFTFGIAMRLAAGAGVVLMGSIYAASLWPERNPVLDQHIVYAVTMIALVGAHAGNVLGLGERWSRSGVVVRNPILR